MIISVNWLKKFTEVDLPIDQLTTLIGARLVEIEDVVNLSDKYKDVLIVRVVKCAPLEGTDHLNLTQIDDGGVRRDVDRDESGLIQVICGAPNVKAGMLAAWLPPASIVPDSFGSDEPFVLSAKKLQGVISNGMLASAKELDLFEDHSGILEVDKDVEAGTSFAQSYDLNDFLLDIENKSLTHRPDTFGIIGFAREVAAIQDRIFVTPEWLAQLDPGEDSAANATKRPNVTIDDPSLSARYQAVVLSGADASRQSPLDVQTYLARVGVRPINAVVDVTNYLMMLTGQPLHAFDYDKLVAVAGGKADIHVRAGKAGESLELLDGRVIELSTDDIVIAAGDVAVGLAGAMGGLNTVIDEHTKNIIIESATFNLYKLRATQMRHGIFSEAITRFTKGQPPELTAPVLGEAVRLMGEWSGAQPISGVAEARGEGHENQSISLTAGRVNSILGTSLSLSEIENILRSVEFAVVEVDHVTLAVAAPYWRADIHIVEDVIEEIGRLRGFDAIMPTLPSRDFSAVSPSAFDVMRERIRQLLARAGANEVLTYSFIHGDVITKAGQVVNNSYKIINSISPDLQYYRQSLTPSLIGLVHANLKQGFDNFAMFEINKVHPKNAGLNDEGVPIELDALALTIASNKQQASAPYYQAKELLEYLASSLGLVLQFNPIASDVNQPQAVPFENKRSAIVLDQSGTVLGVVGEYKKSVSKGFKLPEFSAGFEIDIAKLFEAVRDLKPGYTPLSRYPSVERDVCFQIATDVTYRQLIDAINEARGTAALAVEVAPVDIYQPADGTTKNITVRLQLTAQDHTLTSEEANGVVQMIAGNVVAAIGATII